MKRIVFTVTNDLSYDQRMHRICSSLAEAGFKILLVGRKLNASKPLKGRSFRQKRIRFFFNKGSLFYCEYNIRLFFFLLFTKADCFCAIDLDTILPNYFVSVLKRKKRVYDAHELFTEQIEIITRPNIHKIWLAFEKFAVPKFKLGYTVNDFIKDELKRRYQIEYAVIRNLPILQPTNLTQQTLNNKPLFIYQGAVNKGRCFETLIPAMKHVDANLLICGEGNFFLQTKELIRQHSLENKIILKGWVEPETLKTLTATAFAGITLFESTGLNQYQSLSNRFFDYIMAGIPQICVNYPEYKKINDQFQVALLIENTEPATITAALNNLQNNSVLYNKLRVNCLEARKVLNWNNEALKLIEFWKSICI